MNRRILTLLLLFAPLAIWAQDCEDPAIIAFEGGMWVDEVSWTLVDETGVVIASGDDYSNYDSETQEVCLGSGCHVLYLNDSFGDGWNGALWTLVQFDGQVFGPFTLEEGSAMGIDISVNGSCSSEVEGCTDPEALNYNPNADTDNGTCFYEGDCSGCENEVSDPVCALDPATGTILSYPGPCWALCAGAIVLDAWDCNTDMGGCTDPTATNFDPSATYDDGSCISPCEEGASAATFYLCTFSNGDEVALQIQHESGEIIYSESGLGNMAIIYEDFCLEPGCYTATLLNGAGNTGWNGGYFSLNGSDIDLYNITLAEDETSSTFYFSVDGACESTPGCTDPEAPNYDPEADWNDGSCLPTCDCADEPYDPVCAWDWENGGYTTFDNLCEAECLGLGVAWLGDCDNQPIVGCTDPEALNYNPEATMNQSCVYAPVCSGDELEVSIALVSENPEAEYPPYFYVSPSANGTLANVYSYELDGATYGVGCLEPSCYNFFLYETWGAFGATATVVADGDSTTFTVEPGAYSEAFGWAVGVDGPCVYEVYGCTDEEAENYNPSATADDGSCTYPLVCDDGMVATLYVCTFSNGEAVGLNITADDGTVIYDQQGYSNMAIVYVEVCLDPEACYTVTMTNNAGETGWYGGYYWVHAGGMDLAGGELPDDASESTDLFGWFGACDDGIPGCTDPAASNYEPTATIDDGSCIYPSPCPLGQEVDFTILAPVDAWFEITDEDDEVLTQGDLQDGFWAASACLANGCYTFRMESYGGELLDGSFASMAMEDGTMLSMVAEGAAVMEEGFGVGTDCGGSGFDGYGGSPWEFDETIAFTPYPNPTETVVNIAGNGWDQHLPVDVTARDLTGKVVHRERIAAGTRPRIDVSDWPTGMYLLQLQQGTRLGSAPFMKMR